MIAWFGACIWRFSYVRDFDMAYPQAAMSDLAQPIAAGRQIAVGGGDSTEWCVGSVT